MSPYVGQYAEILADDKHDIKAIWSENVEFDKIGTMPCSLNIIMVSDHNFGFLLS